MILISSWMRIRFLVLGGEVDVLCCGIKGRNNRMKSVHFWLKERNGEVFS